MVFRYVVSISKGLIFHLEINLPIELHMTLPSTQKLVINYAIWITIPQICTYKTDLLIDESSFPSYVI